jgi:methyl-accepting chemotaxis protein
MNLNKKMLLAFASIAALSVAAAGIGVVGFANTRAAQDVVATQGVPVMIAAQQLAGLTTSILEVPPVLRRATTEQGRLATVKSLRQRAGAVTAKLDDLQARGFNAQLVARLRETTDGIVASIDQLGNGVARLIVGTETVDRNNRDTMHALHNITDLTIVLAANANMNIKNVLSSLYDQIGDKDKAGDTLDSLLENNVPLAERMAVMRTSSLVLSGVVDRLAKEVTVEAVDHLKPEFETALKDMSRAIANIDDPQRHALAQSYLDETTRGTATTNPENIFAAVRATIQLRDELDSRASRIAESSKQVFGLLDEVVAEARSTIDNSVASAERVASISQLSLLLLAGTSLVAAGLIIWLFVRRNLLRRLTRLEALMRRLAGGDLAVEVEDKASDELGKMAAALVVFRDAMIQARRLEDGRTAEREHLETEKHAALIGMADRIETDMGVTMQAVGSHVATVMQTAEEMSASAGRTGMSAQGAANAASEVLSNARTAASAAEQLDGSIREISAQVSHSTMVVGRAVAAGNETRTTMQALDERVGHIGLVAQMISDIAAKTNLLALNATIEAARAGDAGKGFAVVASEVKQLANQTARSTEQITRHISEVAAATGASVAAVGRIEQMIGEINAISGSIAAAVEQQGAATTEIARNVAVTAQAANEMGKRIEEVSIEADRTGRHSLQVRDGTAKFSALVGELRESVVRVVRNATA